MAKNQTVNIRSLLTGAGRSCLLQTASFAPLTSLSIAALLWSAWPSISQVLFDHVKRCQHLQKIAVSLHQLLSLR